MSVDPVPGLSTAPGLYLHLPFCSEICPYCDFYVLKGGPEAKEDYLRNLERELLLWEGSDWPEPFDTIYLGGGTPSILEPDQLERLLTAVRRSLPVAEDAYLQMEANPEDASPESLRAWRELGVSFLSLGVQSLEDEALETLGRRHSATEGRRAVERALETGFPIVSLDLIYGRPGQTARQWHRELRAALSLGTPHLSCYLLTIHEGTPFGFRTARGQMSTLSDDRQADLFFLTHRIAQDRGIPGYEVSNFARTPSDRSPHNRKYWHRVPYLGLGPSAHSFDGKRRWWNERKIRPWERALDRGRRPIADTEELTEEQREMERILMGIRTRRGIGPELLGSGPEEDGIPDAVIDPLLREKLLRWEGERLVATLKGWAVADGLAARLASSDGPS